MLVGFCLCGRALSRSGVQPPTGTRSERPTLAKHLPKTPKPVKLFRKTRQSPPNTGRILPLPVVLEPVGGCTPDRNDPPPPNISMRFRIRRADRKIDFYFLSVVPLLSRGWILPVGGSTPDRHKAGTLHPCQTLAQNSKTRQALPKNPSIFRTPVGFCRCRSFWSRSGVSPPTGTIHPRQTLAQNSKTRQALPKKPVNLPRTPVRFCRCRSFWSRSGVSPPTGTLHSRQTLAQNSKTRQALPKNPSIFRTPVGFCRCRSFWSRSGVAPPTGTIHPRQIFVCDSESGDPPIN